MKFCWHTGGKRDERLEDQTCKEMARWSRRRYEESTGQGNVAQAGAQGRQLERKPCWSVEATKIRNSDVCLTVN